MRGVKLSIITINRNNAEGLRKTLTSVEAQTYLDIEHIIIDGASTDGSVEIIKKYAERPVTDNCSPLTVIWSSEPDKGIYNAINKGIRKATGEYIQILNSGDILASADVTERMFVALDSLNAKRSSLNEDAVGIFYGNMIKKDFATGKIINKSGYIEPSLRTFYSGTLNHDCCYIRRDLFRQYGFYDESLKIVSDWKWFLQVIGLGSIQPQYMDLDVTVFDASGISETNLELRNEERRRVLEQMLPPTILWDYDHHAFDAEQMNRLRRHHLYGLVYFMERVLFKLEKWHVLNR